MLLPILALSASLLAAGCGPTSPPQLTDVSPAPSQGAVHTNDPLVVTFNTAMDQRSVENRLYVRTRKNRLPPDCLIAAAAAGRPTGCHFVWRSPKVMTLVHPGHPWKTLTTYRVAIRGGIRASDGSTNPLSHSWEFSTEGGPEVSSTSPGNGGTVGPDQPISINFSREMNPVTVRRAITLSPAPVGGYQLAQSTTVPGRFLIEPYRPLTPGVAGTLGISRYALDTDGNHIKRATRIHFTVGPLGSTTTVVFPAGPTPGAYSEVLAASPEANSGDPPGLRVLATAPAGSHYLDSWPSPDGARLALELTGGQSIQVVDLASGKSTTVLGSVSASTAAWSPDGQRLAFVVGGALRVFTVASATTVTLASSPTLRGPLSWRPDGQVVAAVATPSTGASRVALLSPGLRAITFLPAAAAASDAEDDPVWGPQGSTLAFSMAGPAAAALWIYRPVDTGSPVSLVASRVGRPIAFLSLDTVLVQTPSGELESVSTTTRTASVIVAALGGNRPLAAAAAVPARQVAFSVKAHGFVQIYLANDDGTGLEPLTDFSSRQPLDAGPPQFVGG
ncbi:MAG: Ig-like domain-containing protein [Candidatus Dormibacteria bacterium]